MARHRRLCFYRTWSTAAKSSTNLETTSPAMRYFSVSRCITRQSSGVLFAATRTIPVLPNSCAKPNHISIGLPSSSSERTRYRNNRKNSSNSRSCSVGADAYKSPPAGQPSLHNPLSLPTVSKCRGHSRHDRCNKPSKDCKRRSLTGPNAYCWCGCTNQ